MADKKITLTENMVHASTAFGIHVVREIAYTALASQPQMSLKQFLGVLEQYERKISAAKTVDAQD